ncbi:MAG: TonB-dependent receptor family protein, partial [Bacteroidaceae bacterium]|nr:TonB-dependent receptor family protein [Bacteroidaceae bacterium]
VKGNTNFKIYKNGHYDPSLTKNAKEIFKAMPASSVKRIEVITDPGAREDAEGVNAILNIVMVDTRQMEGVTGSVSGSYSTLNNPGLGAYLTTQFGKAIVSVDYGYNNMSKKSTTHKSYLKRSFVESDNTQIISGESSNPGYIHYADINASYDIDTLNLLSASFGGYFYKVDVQGGGPVSMFNSLGNPLYSYTESYWLPSYNHNSWNGRLDYEHKTRRKGELFTLSYMLALTRQHSEQEDTYTNMQNTPFNYAGLLVNTREHFTEHTFQADYIRPLWEGHKLEVGTKYIDRRNSSNNNQEYYNSTLPSTNTAFDHSTQIAAAYADYIYNKEKWSARAGLRYEYSYLKGHYPDGSSTDFDKHLNDWVPQASVKYQINDGQSLKLGYTTSITRPGITYLNPAVVSMPASVNYGMPQLVSTRQQTLSLTYMYIGQRLTLQLVPHYSYYQNGIGSFIYSQGDVRYSTYGNNLRQHRWQMEGYVQWKPFDGTTIVANINFTDNYAKNTDANLSQHTDNLFYYVNLSQKLPWNLRFTAYTFGQFGHSPMNIYAYSRAWNCYAFTLQRSFLSDDRLTIRLLACAPFNKDMHNKTRTTQGDIIGWGDNITTANGRYFKLTVSYRFGKLKASVKKTETTIENSDVVGGITKGNN